MWHVNVPNHAKVGVTKFRRCDADLLFAALRAMRDDPLGGYVYALGRDSYYRVVASYLIFFDGGGNGISVPCAIDVAGCGLVAVSVAVVEIGTCGLLLDHAQDRGRVRSPAEQAE